MLNLQGLSHNTRTLWTEGVYSIFVWTVCSTDYNCCVNLTRGFQVTKHVQNDLEYQAYFRDTQFEQFSVFDLKWPFRVKFLWQIKGRQTKLEWIRGWNVVEWYPFCPGFNFIFTNDQKSYLGPPTVEKIFFWAIFRTILRHSMHFHSLDS